MKQENDRKNPLDPLNISKQPEQLSLEDIDPELLETFLSVKALRKRMENRLLGDTWTTNDPVIH